MKFRNISPDDPIISSPFKDLIREDMYGSSAFDDFDSYNQMKYLAQYMKVLLLMIIKNSIKVKISIMKYQQMAF